MVTHPGVVVVYWVYGTKVYTFWGRLFGGLILQFWFFLQLYRVCLLVTRHQFNRVVGWGRVGGFFFTMSINFVFLQRGRRNCGPYIVDILTCAFKVIGSMVGPLLSFGLARVFGLVMGEENGVRTPYFKVPNGVFFRANGVDRRLT